MNNEIKISATRDQLIAALAKWDAQARAEGWPDEPDAERSADHLIALLAQG